ncbi:MAG TPA: UPF0158 family protein [Xanthobacteraceae bacterium]|jgi:hypothetical protein
MALTYSDLCIAYEFINSAEQSDYQGFVCRKTGKIYLRAGEFSDPLPDADELPEDLDENLQYVRLPSKREFDLGKPLPLKFAREFLADDYDEVRRIFSRKGAYGNFKALLARRRALDRWYQFEEQAEQRALREWCTENGIELAD